MGGRWSVSAAGTKDYTDRFRGVPGQVFGRVQPEFPRYGARVACASG